MEEHKVINYLSKEIENYTSYSSFTNGLFFNNFIGKKHHQSLERILRYPKGTERERDTETHARRIPTLKANVIKQ